MDIFKACGSLVQLSILAGVAGRRGFFFRSFNFSALKQPLSIGGILAQENGSGKEAGHTQQLLCGYREIELGVYCLGWPTVTGLLCWNLHSSRCSFLVICYNLI